MIKPTLLILAAGMGSRYGSLKQVDPVGPSGETILEYSIYDAIRSGFGKVVFVIRKSLENDFNEIFIKKLRKYIEVSYVFQELDMIPKGYAISPDRVKPWGTGHAVLVTKSEIHEPFAVINADDYYGVDAYRKMSDFLTELTNVQSTYAMVGFDLNNTLSEHGFVSRGICEVDEHSYLVTVAERTKIGRDQLGVAYHNEYGEPVYVNEQSIVSMNYWGFTPEFFSQLELQFQLFIDANYNNIKAELYLPTVMDELIRSRQAQVRVLRSSDQWCGVTYKDDKPMVVERIKNLVQSGVYPQTLWE